MTELILRGRVQGVFCRHYCSQTAKRFGLHGSATNLWDGSVQVILATDDETLISQYIQALQNNPFGIRFFGKITDIEVHRNYQGRIEGDYEF
ncbi:MAG: acylphosphatase [Spirochaetes bacterium]|nr:acylphosphatase [Spirochaetota bacterium]